MAGVPQAIDLIPEFVTGRQLYDYISHHFRKTISNPITVFPLFPLFSAANRGKHDEFFVSPPHAARSHAHRFDPHHSARLLLLHGLRASLPLLRLASSHQRRRRVRKPLVRADPSGNVQGRVGFYEGGGDGVEDREVLRVCAQNGGCFGDVLHRVPLAERVHGMRHRSGRHAAELPDDEPENRGGLGERLLEGPLPSDSVREHGGALVGGERRRDGEAEHSARRVSGQVRADRDPAGRAEAPLRSRRRRVDFSLCSASSSQTTRCLCGSGARRPSW